MSDEEIVSAQDVITDSPEGRALAVIGRPPIEPTQEIVDRICDMLREGKTVRVIGDTLGSPSTATIRRWVEGDEDFRRAYFRAKESFCDDQLEQCLEICDDAGGDFDTTQNEDGTVTIRANPKSVGRSQHQVETRFRVIAKMEPRKYGEEPQATIEPVRNGDDARVIDGVAIPIHEHPLYEPSLAWSRILDERGVKR